MATTTPNFGWSVPTSSDLVKNGATAIETLGDSVDASLWNSGYGQAGKNKIINGDFLINQRQFTSNTTNGAYGFDRFFQATSGGTHTCTPQTFTPGTAPVAGYEGKTFLQSVTASQTLSSGFAGISQKIESSRTFAGQTVVVSFWAKANTGTPKVGVSIQQAFGTGGSPSASTRTAASTTATLSTSWARYSMTVAVPSVSGVTFGTTNDGSCNIQFWQSLGSDYTTGFPSGIGLQNFTLSLWGVQVEYGTYATPFQTASGSIAGELALAQRYYSKTYNQSEAPGYSPATGAFNAINASTTLVVGIPVFKVSTRTSPTVTLFSPATGTSGKIRSGGADVTATTADVGENGIGYISATGLVAGSNSTICYVADAEL
jgi:hypothetical protein